MTFEIPLLCVHVLGAVFTVPSALGADERPLARVASAEIIPGRVAIEWIRTPGCRLALDGIGEGHVRIQTRA